MERLTMPPADLTRDRACEQILDASSPRTAGMDMETVLDTAALYAGRALMPALAPLAFRLNREGALALGEGWTIRPAGVDHGPARSDLVLEQSSSAGCFHLRIAHHRPMTFQGAERMRQLHARRIAALAGLDSRARVKRLLSCALDGDREAREIEALPDSLEPVTADTGIDRYAITAIDHGGRPAFAESVDRLETHLGAGPQSGMWWPGIVFTARRRVTPGFPEIDTSRRGEAVTDLLVLRLLGKAILEAGLEGRVAAENIELGTSRWQHYGDSRDGILAQAAMALVHGSAGLVTDQSLHDIGAVVADLTALSLDDMPRIASIVAAGLQEAGHTDAQSAFVHNDLDNRAWAMTARSGFVVGLSDQNGAYELIREADLFVARRVDIDTPHLIGEFTLGNAGLSPTPEHYAKVPFTLRAVREITSLWMALQTAEVEIEEMRPDDAETAVPGL